MTRRSLTARLCLMMFFEQGVRGTWYPYLANYLTAPRANHGLGFSSGQTGWVLGFGNALGAITAPLVAGQVADRYLNAERALSILHVLSAILLIFMSSQTAFPPFLLFTLLFSIAYVPTQSLTNSLALSHLEDREHSYPRVRLWGTIGWMVTGSLFTYIVLRSPDPAINTARIAKALQAAAALAIAYAMYAFFLLPETPPTVSTPGQPAVSGAERSAASPRFSALAPARALAMMRDPSILVLTLIALPVAAIHTAYYLNIGPFLTTVVGIPQKLLGPTLSISQTSEVVLLFTLGPILRRFGYKTVLTIGAAAQAVRFIVFAIAPPAPFILVSLTMHGVAYACFFTSAILYIERCAPPDIRHSAQTVFGIVLFGLGPALAGPYSQFFDLFIKAGRPNFPAIWTIQAVVASASALGILLFFRPRLVQQNPPLATENPSIDATVE